MPDKNYYHVKWKAYAEIDSERIEISGFEVTYQLDEIPKATFVPVVGRDGRTGEEAPAIDSLLDSAPYTPIKIYINGETDEDSPQANQFPGFPFNTDYVILDGYYQGIHYTSFRRDGSQPGVVAVGGSAAGWLLGMVGTSANTRKNTIKGPGGFAELALVGLEPNPNPLALFNASTAVSANPEFAVDDLWQEYIKKLFLAIVVEPEVWGDTENNSALEALNRMDDGEQFEGAELQLSMDNIRGQVDKKVVGEWLTANFARALYAQWRGSTLWSTLKWAAGQYGFRIVPLIDTATCAPVFGALGGEVHRQINADEYHNVNITFETPQLITKVVVVSKNAGTVAPWESGPRISAVVGQASADDVSDYPYEGAAIRVTAPDWLGAEPMIGKLTRISVGKDIGIPDALNAEALQYQPDEDEDYSRIYKNFIQSEMGNAYARLVLLNEMLYGRTGIIEGRFRLDIAPGSTIAVGVVGGGKFSDDPEPRYLYGLVEKVVLRMHGGSGGTGQAYTKIFMRNVMTATEHDGYLGILTEDKHPIYKATYVGARLTGNE